MVAQQPDPILAYTWAMDRPFRLRETLHLYADGQIWYWSPAAGGEHARDRAGTFFCPAATGRAADARTLAEHLLDLPPQPVSPVPGAIEMRVTAALGERTRAHVLAPAPGSPLEALLQQAYDQGEQLLALAESAPLAVVRLAFRIEPQQLAVGERATALFTFESLGTKDVVFRLHPETLMVCGSVADAWATWWKNGEQNRIGLVGPKGTLIDGFYAPAHLGQGGRGTVAFLEAIEGEPGTFALNGLADGLIELLYPAPRPVEGPQEPMSLVTAATRLQIGS